MQQPYSSSTYCPFFVSAVFPFLQNRIWRVPHIAGKLLFWVALFAVSTVYGQSFSNQTSLLPAGALNYNEAYTSWGDYDRDGDLDVLVMGQTATATFSTQIFRNDGGAGFTNMAALAANLPDVRYGVAIWGDYNEDDKLDILIAGQDNSLNIVTEIYQLNIVNTVYVKDNTASNAIASANAQVINACADWGDYDNDGDLDLLLSGRDNTSSVIAKIFENTGGSTFSEDVLASTNIGGIENGTVKWGDMDNDGFLDIVLTGANSSGQPATRLYRNSGVGTFANVVTLLPNLKNGSVDLGDYDADGDLDILLTGEDLGGSTFSTKVFRNNGSNVYQDMNVSVANVSQGHAAWGDYDNDGDMDFVVSGKSGPAATNRTTSLYIYNGSAFVINAAASTVLTGLNQGAYLSWGDYDGDNKLDVLAAGMGPSGRSLKLYRNTGTGNTSPAAPAASSLLAQQVGDEMILSWAKPSGGTGYTFNLYVQNTATLDVVKVPMANINTGYRRVVGAGNTNHKTSWRLTGLANGTYAWRVQSVDADFEGSAFVSGTNFTYTAPVPGSLVFVDVTNVEFASPLPTGLTFSNIAFGDQDADGDLDFIVSGSSGSSRVTKVYQHFKNGVTYTENNTANLSINLDISKGFSAWGDSDGDGDLDLLISGEAAGGTRKTELYRNDGSNIFTALSTPLVPMVGSSGDWGDYDNDGDLDILISGSSALGVDTKVYTNLGNNTFAEIAGTTPNGSDDGVEFGAVAWGDYDNDTYLDILISGNSVLGPRGIVLHNDQDGTFSISGISVGSLQNSDVDWGDYDNDGWLDFIMVGEGGGSPATALYRNQGNGSFQVVTTPFPGIMKGSVAFGDYNDDGFLDVLMVGQNGISALTRTAKIYQNTGSGSFIEDVVASGNLDAVNGGADAVWGDYNLDGKLDILLTGTSSGGTQIFKLYKNVDPGVNTTPQVPENLVANLAGFNVNFSWDPPSGHSASTVDGLNYNLYVKTPPAGAGDVQPSNSRSSDGYRQIVHLGNANLNTNYTLTGLTPGTYCWSVQAVDQDFEGSLFATEQCFVYDAPTFIDTTAVEFPLGIPAGIAESDVIWGDFDKDGDLDILASGRSAANAFSTTLYENDNGSYVTDINATNQLPGIRNGSVSWVDFDNDQELDVFISGLSAAGRKSELYRNQGPGAFDFIISPISSFIPLSKSAAAWGDFNNDGFADLLLTGENNSSQPQTLLYQNNEGTSFTLVPTGITHVRNGAVAWADYDQDGDLDILISGETSSGAYSGIYENDGAGGFTDIAAGFPLLENSSVAWGDYDNDGDPDVLLTGRTTAGVPVSKVFRNLGSNTFIDIAAPLVGVYSGSAAWGDYNNDGFQDIMITGKNGSGAEDRVSRLYEYLPGTNVFAEDVTAQAPLTAVDGGSAIFGDYNQDSKLDILLTGRSMTTPVAAEFLLLYNNDATTPVGPPGLPTNPTSTLSGFEVLLSWDPPTGYPAALVDGLSYNIRIGSSATVTDQLSPLSITGSGYRKVVQMGNAGQMTTDFPVKDLVGGTYHWGVQAVDADFEGSGFVSGGTFTYTPPTFVDVTTEQFPALPVGIQESDMDWGDYDNDGDLDLVVCGEVNAATHQTIVYRNDAGSFTDMAAGIPGVAKGSVAWGDYDNDGWLDILVAGELNTEPFTKVYRNLAGASFQDINAGLTPIMDGKALWGDYNQDGYLDVLLTGQGTVAVGPVGAIFEYDPVNGFTDIGASLPELIFSTAAWGDFDQDSYPDILIAGQNPAGGGAPLTRLYRNDANGGFVNTGIAFPGLRFPSLDWGDYDNDGNLDILMTGEVTTPAVDELSRIYRNVGNGTFTVVSNAAAPLAQVKQGDAQFADFDDDGDLDIVLVGQSGAIRVAEAYRNTSNGAFVQDDVVALPFTDIDGGGSIAFGDFNNDNKLDLAAAGRSLSSPLTRVLRLYENVDTVSNIVPGIPTALQSTVSGDTVILSWNAPANGNGFSYNVYIGTTPGAIDVLSPMSDLSNGYRRVVKLGRGFTATSFHLRELAGGTYYWSVQAIDQDFEGSAFAAEQSFLYEPPTLVNTSPLIISPAPEGLNNGKVSWIDADRDGDLDLMVSGERGANDYIARVYRNNNGNFNLIFDTLGVRFPAIAWADYDLDGDADLLLSGQNNGGNRLTTLLRNNAGSGLVAVNNPFPDVYGSAAAWGDYDNDGDPDLLIAGNVAANTYITEIYRNEGGSFVVDSFASDQLPNVQFGAVSWGDYDADGWLDIVLAGETNTGLITRVFRNQQNRSFVDINATLTGVKEGSVEWGDVNNDGLLDLLITGESAAVGFSPVSRVYRNNAGTFVPYALGVLQPVKRGSATFGDYDDDGLIDILLTGQDGASSNDRATRLYKNTGTGFAEEAGSSLGLENADLGSHAAWGDYDRDGKLDVALIGRTAASPSTARTLSIYRNTDATANLTAIAPASLVATPSADSVTLSWQAPAGYPAALVDGLSYNVYVSSMPTPADPDRVSPHATVGTGYRRLVQLGPHTGTSWTIRDLPTGTWYWSVQAIEADFEGSPFAAEQSFVHQAPVFVDETSFVTRSGNGEGMDESAIAWGDYDNDNDLDLLLTGQTATEAFYTSVWENVSGELQENTTASAVFDDIRSGTAIWGDMNQDDELDIAIAGESATGPVTKIYRQVNGVFTDIGAGLTGLRNSSLAWADFDRNGDLDLLISGENNAGQPLTSLMINDGNEGFADSGIPLTNVTHANASWNDFDNDGWLDLLISGEDAGGQGLTQLYHNDGDGSLIAIASAFPNVKRGANAWVDYDNDGWADVLISGESATGPITELYINNGDDTFTNSGINFVGIQNGKVAWGDYDDDGYADLVLTGQNGTVAADRTTLIYHNNAGTNFTVDVSASAPFSDANTLSDAAWGDYTGDGKLDLAMAGRTADAPVDRILGFYRNNQATPNQLLQAPDTLMNDPSGADVVLSWAAPAMFDPTLVEGLTYNVYVGTGPGLRDVINPHADTTGYRKVVAAGNTGQAKSIRITGLGDGIYYWSVQAVGPDWEGSIFATEASFRFNQKAFKDVTVATFPFGTPQAVSEAAVKFGDFDNNGSLDLIAAGALDNLTNSTTIYSNNMGLFQENGIAAANMANVRKSSIDVEDYDNDGFVDVLLSGLDESGTPVTHIYHNEGDSTFDLDMAASSDLENVSDGSVAWGDYNNDGKPDVLVTGESATGPFAQLYRNDGNSTFTAVPDAFAVGQPQAVSQSAVAWADYDADGDLDFILTGRASSGPFTGLYRNNGDGTFSAVATPMLDVMQGSVAWGDFENDGDLDVVISGENSTSLFVPVTKLYVYDRTSGTFGDPLTPVSLLDAKNGSVAWGDYNNDGFADILLSGRFGEEDTAVTTKIYQNEGGTGFSEDINTSSVLADVDLGQSIFGNFDNLDGLDIILTGQTSTNPPERAFGAYLNIDSTLNITPPSPRLLASSVLGNSVTLTWEAPDAYPLDRVDGLTYNIYVGSDVGLIDQFSPKANLNTGWRQVVKMGGSNLSTSWTITGLQAGTYFWSVQSVDQDFEGSPFASEEFFLFINPAPVIIDSSYATVYVDTSAKSISTIEVEDTSVVERVVVHYKGIAGADWSTLTLTDPGPEYTFDIVPSLLDEIGIEYYFEAVGKFGFSAVTDTTYTYIRYTGDGLEIPSLQFGPTVRDYNIIAIPLDLDNRAIASTIEDDLGTYDIFKWRFYHYQGGSNTEYNSGVSQIDAGQGYWLIAKDRDTVYTGSGETVKVHDQKPFGLSLSQGWNQIGNPYNFKISWSEILDSNSVSVQNAFIEPFRNFQNGWDTLGTPIIDEFRGGFVFAESAVEVKIPVRKNPAIQRFAPVGGGLSLTNPLDQPDWEVKIRLKSQGLFNPFGGIGMRADADSSRDQYDRISLPRLHEYLDVNFAHPEYFGGRFMKDVRPTAKEAIWEFTVESNLEEELIQLSWDNSYFGSGLRQLILFDVAKQRQINMAERDSYTSLSDDKSRNFRIYYGAPEFIDSNLQPDHIHLGQAYPNPFTDQTLITLSLPETAEGEAYGVQLAIFDQMGKRVATLKDGWMESGFHEINWNGTNELGTGVSPGMYIYQVNVVYGGQQKSYSGKVIRK